MICSSWQGNHACEQGAIGSEYKIDASYLSPNVNVASKLEARDVAAATIEMLMFSVPKKTLSCICVVFPRHVKCMSLWEAATSQFKVWMLLSHSMVPASAGSGLKNAACKQRPSIAVRPDPKPLHRR